MKKLLVMILIFLSFSLFCTIINIPGDYPTIQHGIDVAAENDTVLVADGIYYENLQIIGKEIMLASLYIIDEDSVHIENTIIDGSSFTNANEASVIAFLPGANPNAVPRIIGLTIINGFGWRIEETIPTPEGPVTIEKKVGGGLYIELLNPIYTQNIIIENEAEDEGGGGYALNSEPNFGGEIEFEGNWNWERAINPGGNTFLNNYAAIGKTIFAQLEDITYTLYFENCEFDIFNSFEENLTNYWISTSGELSLENSSGIDEFITSDVYVSPNGDDENDGLTPQTPFKHINYALSQVYADSQNPIVINIAEGVYSPSLTGEEYPLNVAGYISLIGSGENVTILNAEATNNILVYYNSTGGNIQFLTITNGNQALGGGVYLNYSNPDFEDVIIMNNNSIHGGGFFSALSNSNLINVLIYNNHTDYSGGGIFGYHSDLTLDNAIIMENLSDLNGGGIFLESSSPIISNSLIIENSALYHGGGIACWNSSNPNIINTTISNNSGNINGGLYCAENSNPTLTNTILWDNSQPEIFFYDNWEQNSITIQYSDIEGGEDEIETNNNGIVNWLVGNINNDPLFIDPENGNFHLQESSPCIDVGSPSLPADPDGTISDIGKYYFHHYSEEIGAEFTANQTLICPGTLISFTDNSGAFNSEPINSWIWDFNNDGQPDSYLQNPYWLYLDIGLYTVSLAVSNGQLEDSITKEDYISVVPFLMDGFVDSNTQLHLTSNDLDLWIGYEDDFIYFASSRADDDSDIFILLSTELASIRDAPWVKEGNVVNWNYYLANEGTNNWMSWFDESEEIVSNSVYCTSDSVLEGYIPISLLNNPDTLFIALTQYETGDGGSLINQLPLGNNNPDIEFNEYYTLDFQEIGINDDNEIINQKPILKNNYPNPFNPDTYIGFHLVKDSRAEINVFNIKGQKVKTLVNKTLNSGYHTIKWNGIDENNKSVASGIYIYHLRVNGKEKGIKKMLLLK